MEVTAHLDNLCPPFMKQHHSPDKNRKAMANCGCSRERWNVISFLLLSLWSSFCFVIICVFVPLQLCSYDVLCASVDVKRWKPVHANL